MSGPGSLGCLLLFGNRLCLLLFGNRLWRGCVFPVETVMQWLRCGWQPLARLVMISGSQLQANWHRNPPGCWRRRGRRVRSMYMPICNLILKDHNSGILSDQAFKSVSSLKPKVQGCNQQCPHCVACTMCYRSGKLNGWLASMTRATMMRSLVISLVLLSCLCVPAHSFGFSLDTIKSIFSKPSGPHPPVFPSSFEVGAGDQTTG